LDGCRGRGDDAVRSADRDRTGRTWAALIAAVTAVGLAATGAVVADGWAPVVAVVAYLAPIAVATVFGVIAVASLVKSLHRQLLLAGAVTVAGLAATIALSVEAMYVSQHDALLTVLLAAVSHDLRTPITSLQLLVEAIDDDIVDADTRQQYLARMATHVRALTGMVGDVFELSRLEAGDIHWSMQRVGLEALVAETVDALRVPAEADGVAVRSEVDPGLQSTRARPELLRGHIRGQHHEVGGCQRRRLGPADAASDPRRLADEAVGRAAERQHGHPVKTSLRTLRKAGTAIDPQHSVAVQRPRAESSSYEYEIVDVPIPLRDRAAGRCPVRVENRFRGCAGRRGTDPRHRRRALAGRWRRKEGFEETSSRQRPPVARRRRRAS
jgi:hypothetical protein